MRISFSAPSTAADGSNPAAEAKDSSPSPPSSRQATPVTTGTGRSIRLSNRRTRYPRSRARSIMARAVGPAAAGSISGSSAPPYQPSRKASRSISSSSPNKIASSGLPPLAQPLEHSKANSSRSPPQP